MNKKISDRTKLIWLIVFSVFLLFLAVLVYYFQNNNLGISADETTGFNVTDSNWASEEVVDGLYLDVKSFTVDSNNILHFVNRYVTSSTDTMPVSYLTRYSTGWNSIEAPITLLKTDTKLMTSVIDKNNNLHIFVQEVKNGSDIQHYFYNGEEWTNNNIQVGANDLLANRPTNKPLVDSKNQLYLLLYDNKNQKYSIKYQNNGSWETNSISNITANYGANWAMDGLNNIYLFDYYLSSGNQFSSEAIAIYYSADNWQSTIFDYDDFELAEGSTAVSSGSVLGQNLIVDSNNHAHMLARKQTTKNGWHQDYYYLTNKSGAWTDELIIDDAIYDNDRGVSMALDMSGYPHIAYVQDTGMKYKYFDGSTWQTETYNIDNMTKNSDIQLVIDKNNISHILYDKSYANQPIYHIAKQIAPYKEFVGVDSETSSTATPSYTATMIDSDDIDGDGIANSEDPDIDGDGIPNESDSTPTGETVIGSVSTNVPSGSSTATDISQVTSLVSTGASLWFNILIAVLISTCIGYYMFRNKIHGEQ